MKTFQKGDLTSAFEATGISYAQEITAQPLDRDLNRLTANVEDQNLKESEAQSEIDLAQSLKDKAQALEEKRKNFSHSPEGNEAAGLQEVAQEIGSKTKAEQEKERKRTNRAILLAEWTNMSFSEKMGKMGDMAKRAREMAELLHQRAEQLRDQINDNITQMIQNEDFVAFAKRQDKKAKEGEGIDRPEIIAQLAARGIEIDPNATDAALLRNLDRAAKDAQQQNIQLEDDNTRMDQNAVQMDKDADDLDAFDSAYQDIKERYESGELTEAEAEQELDTLYEQNLSQMQTLIQKYGHTSRQEMLTDLKEKIGLETKEETLGHQEQEITTEYTAAAETGTKLNLFSPS